MRKLLLILVAVVPIGLGASRWYSTKKREQLIRSETGKLGYMTNGESLANAASTLGALGADADDAIPALIEVLLRNERPDWNTGLSVKGTVAHALASIGPASVGPLLNAVRDPRNRDRVWGIRPPTSTGDAAYPALFSAFGLMKTKFGPEFDSKAIDDTLMELMTDHDCSTVRAWAARTIGVKPDERIPRAPWNGKRQQIAYWTKGLDHKDPYARAWAAHILGDNRYDISLLADWTEALPALAVAIADDDRLVREESAHALYLLVQVAKGEARGVVPALVGAIEKSGKKPNPPWSFYERNLYGSLGAIGSEASGAVPLLLRILKDKESEFRSQAANALGKIGDADAIPELINTLDDSDHHLISASAEALGRFRSSAKQAVPQLLELLDDTRMHSIAVSGKHPEGIPITVRETVAKALGKIDPERATQATGL